MDIFEDYASIYSDCKQLNQLNNEGTHTLGQTVISLSRMRCQWYNDNGITARLPARPFVQEPSLSIALQYDQAEQYFPQEGKIYDSYMVFIDEILRQYDYVREYIKPIASIEHYPSSDTMRDDLRNGKLKYLPTEATWDEKDIELGYYMYNFVQTCDGEMCVNDVFRIVHDAFAHSAGFSFNKYGEYFAWWTHRDSLTQLGRYALFCETRAQNTWTNMLPEHAKLHISQRPFPPPKAVLYKDSLV